MSKYNTNQEYFQGRTGKGQFSSSKRVSTNAELQAKQAQQMAVAQSQANREWLESYGLGDVEADELFASAKGVGGDAISPPFGNADSHKE